MAPTYYQSLVEGGCRYVPPIGHVNKYPTLRYFGNPRQTQSMIACTSENSSEKLRCMNVVNMPMLLSGHLVTQCSQDIQDFVK